MPAFQFPLTLAELSLLPHTRTRRGREWRLACPIHGGHNPTAFSVNLENGLYQCFSCGASGKLREYREGNTNPLPVLTPFSYPSFDPQKLIKRELWLKGRQKSLTWGQNYLSSRGISLNTARRLGLGYTSSYHFQQHDRGLACKLTRPAILFPLHTPGGFINYYARGVGTERLHHIPSGEKGVFNARAFLTPKPDQPLLLVEGGFDALAAVEAGYPHTSALIGTSLIRPEWYQGQSRIILAFDNDTPGKSRQLVAARQLTALGIRCYSLQTHFFRGCKDFGEYWQKLRVKPNWRELIAQSPEILVRSNEREVEESKR